MIFNIFNKCKIKKKKGLITIYFVFIILAVIIILISAVIAPLGVRFNTEMYKAGEKIYLDTNKSLQLIQNDSVKAEVFAIINGGFDNVQNNIEVNNAIFQYGWILIIGLISLVLFLYSRMLVEVQGGGGFI